MRSVLQELTDRARGVGLLRRLFGMWRGGTARLEDRRLGISTERLLAARVATAHQDAHFHVPLAYGQARRVLRTLQLQPGDVVVDVGCGLGRLVALAARTSVARVVGIECDPSMANAARANVCTLQGRRAPVEIHTVDAACAMYRDVTCVILFNPFGPATMRAVLRQLRLSLLEDPRTIRIAYVNPVAEAELLACGWLERTGVTRSPWYRHEVTFWRSTI